MSVDWNSGKLMPAPRKNRPNRRETKYLCTCDSCGRQRWLTKSHAEKDRICAACQRKERSQKGYKAAVKNHGRLRIIEAVQQYQMVHLSPGEKAVADALTECGIPFEQQVIIERGCDRYWLVDFLLAGMTVIEVVNAFTHKDRKATDQIKYRWLRDRGYRVCEVWDHNLADFLRNEGWRRTDAISNACDVGD